MKLFPRLTETVQNDLRSLGPAPAPDKWRQAPVAIRLAFGWADTEGRLPVLTGTVAAGIPAVCQRCLEPFEMPLEASLKLLFCDPGMPPVQTTDYELWELEEATIRPLDILDEALLMALPLAAMHESADGCGPLAQGVTDGEAGDIATGKIAPFAELGSQLRDRK